LASVDLGLTVTAWPESVGVDVGAKSKALAQTYSAVKPRLSTLRHVGFVPQTAGNSFSSSPQFG
jgi:hypothetical protein